MLRLPLHWSQRLFSLSLRWESAVTDTACAPMNTLKWMWQICQSTGACLCFHLSTGCRLDGCLNFFLILPDSATGALACRVKFVTRLDRVQVLWVICSPDMANALLSNYHSARAESRCCHDSSGCAVKQTDSHRRLKRSEKVSGVKQGPWLLNFTNEWPSHAYRWCFDRGSGTGQSNRCRWRGQRWAKSKRTCTGRVLVETLGGMPEVWGKANGSIGAEPQVQPILIHITSPLCCVSLPCANVVCFLPSMLLFIPLTGTFLLRGLIPSRLQACFSVLLRRWGLEVRNTATSSARIDRCFKVLKASNNLLGVRLGLRPNDFHYCLLLLLDLCQNSKGLLFLVLKQLVHSQLDVNTKWKCRFFT